MSLPPSIMDDIIFLLKNKNEFDTLILLRYHDFLNLSDLSELLDRSKSNVMTYVNNLEDNEFIQVVDKEKLPVEIQQKKGPKKYYELKQSAKKLFSDVFKQLFDIPLADMIEEQISSSEIEFAQSLVAEIQNYIQTSPQDVNPIVPRSYIMSRINDLMEELSYKEYLARMETFSKVVINNLAKLTNEKTREEALRNLVKEADPSIQINQLYHIPVNSLDDAKELGGIVVNFLHDLQAFKERQAEKIENPKGFQHIYFFTGYLKESILD